jgi:hypothetical protein
MNPMMRQPFHGTHLASSNTESEYQSHLSRQAELPIRLLIPNGGNSSSVTLRRVNVGIFLEKLTVFFLFFFSISTHFFFLEKKVRVKIQVSLALETEFRRFFWSM